jgi:guanine nucleotide-binding protein alpha-1 subunit
VSAVFSFWSDHLTSSSRSFLDDLYRIAHRGYEPTDDDVVRARLRTMGVQEYRFVLETGTLSSDSVDRFYDRSSVEGAKQEMSGYFTMSEDRDHM